MPFRDQENIIALRIHIDGLVQGVGFRPFVYRLAQLYHLQGWVVNRTDGVSIKVEGLAHHMTLFLEDLRYKAPVVSRIEEISVDQDYPEGLHGFFILASQDMTDETSEICPDIAVCADCLADMDHQPHRRDYPFINCTNCGPRFSIVLDFPYDRKNTTMASFSMCALCGAEYSDIADRRFHAQPVACNQCGPRYEMHTDGHLFTTREEILDQVNSRINLGGILAIKGTGGFHLMCDAMNANAVDLLRNLKKREGKPFAVMFRDMDSVKKYAEVSETEEMALTSWRRPIVILKAMHDLAPGVTLGLSTLGAFLPYMPMHYMIFRRINQPALVLTSGNLAEEPIIIGNEEALDTFNRITNAVITYNRDIHNRNDDSVVRVIAGKESVHRRSRGYVPEPIKLGVNVDGMLATGAELSNCFCIGKENKAYLSQHIGDLKNQETLAFFEESVKRFQQLFRVKPNLVASDLHPDYLSTRYALDLGIEHVGVQHHHAHIASCMAENGLDEPVIGLAFDGTGYGDDGNIWGSEFLVCDFSDYSRAGHFEYLPMPGGDKAAEEPWRMGISLLYKAFGTDLFNLDLPILHLTDPAKNRMIVMAIEKGINCPLSSGMGRLFDAVAAITGICVNALFHAEAPMRLESLTVRDVQSFYDFSCTDTISILPAIHQICHDMQAGVQPEIIATKFHNTIAEASFQLARKIRDMAGIQKVILSGGTFQNKYLAEVLENKLVKDNFAVYSHSRVPCNDGGIALGQISVAARRRELGTRDKGQGTRDKQE